MLALELRLESRYRIHVVAAVLAGSWTAILLVVPARAARVITPYVLFIDTATVGVFLLAGMVLLERSERTLAAMLTTPLRTGELRRRQGGRAGRARPGDRRARRRRGRPPGPSAPCPCSAASPPPRCCCCCSASPSSPAIAPSPPFSRLLPGRMIPLMGVPLARLVGLVDHPLAVVVPTVPAADLIASGFDRGVAVRGGALLSLAVWVGGAGVLAVRRFSNHRPRDGRLAVKAGRPSPRSLGSMRATSGGMRCCRSSASHRCCSPSSCASASPAASSGSSAPTGWTCRRITGSRWA